MSHLVLMFFQAYFQFLMFFGGISGETGPGAGQPGGPPDRSGGPTELVF
jgi:hypothetical protein